MLGGEGHVERHRERRRNLVGACYGALGANLFLDSGDRVDVPCVLPASQFGQSQGDCRHGGAVVQGLTRGAAVLERAQRGAGRDVITHTHQLADPLSGQPHIDEQFVPGWNAVTLGGRKHMRWASPDHAWEDLAAMHVHFEP